MADPRYYLSNR